VGFFLNGLAVILYHFTNLLNLPGIMRDGITLGEVPVSHKIPYCDRPKAANLTRIKEPKENTFWCKQGPTNKLKIRLTVDVPDKDLMMFADAVIKYKIADDWVKKLAPENHRKQWYYAFGGVKPSQIIRVERLVDGKYEKQDQAALATLIAAIETERNLKFTFHVVQDGLDKGARGKMWKPGQSTSWLEDGNSKLERR
jgi:hypothetical protein